MDPYAGAGGTKMSATLKASVTPPTRHKSVTLEGLEAREINTLMKMKKEFSIFRELSIKVKAEGVKEGIEKLYGFFNTLVANRSERRMLRPVQTPTPDLKKEMVDLRGDVAAMLRESHRSVVEAGRVVLGDPGDSRQILDAIAEVRLDLAPRSQKSSWIEVAKRRPSKIAEKEAKESQRTLNAKSRVKKRKPVIMIYFDPEEFPALVKKISTGVDQGAIGNRVTEMRQTRTGGLLVEVDGDSLAVEVVRVELSKAAGEGVRVRTLAQKSLLEIRDIASWAREKDVRQALVSSELLLEETKIINIRSVYGGSRVATILVPHLFAERMAAIGRMKVGMVYCRARLRESKPRCFRCLALGHEARECKGANRERYCRRCGLVGHFAVQCWASQEKTDAVRVALADEAKQSVIKERNGASERKTEDEGVLAGNTIIHHD